MKHDIELLLRSGKRQLVERHLLSLNLSKVARAEVLPLSNAASRINRFDLALRILNPYVRGTQGEAKPEEQIEYANALRKLGAVAEAASILERVDAKIFPQIHFYLALCNFAHWRYDLALPHLETYIANLDPQSYAHKVGRVNYASALISSGDINQSSDLLNLLYEETRNSDAHVLCANSLELKAQIEILHNEDWKKALGYLQEARYWLEDDRQNIANLFVRKWEAIALSKIEKKLSSKLSEVREDALKLGHWETARDCNYFFAEFTQDTSALLKMYFGTPYESFREKIKSRNPNLLIPDTFLWGTPDGPIFDLRTAETETAFFNCGQMSHRLLTLLAKDFYKPTPLLGIFSSLFPEEYSNPFTSPNRVHQLVRQLRLQLSETQLPLIIVQDDSGYKLKFDGPIRLCVTSTDLSLDPNEMKWLRLKTKIKMSSFTNKDVSHVLETSRASVQRLLEWALKTGHAEQLAGGRSAKYKLVS